MRNNVNNRKKVQMPSGIRQKMMAAVSMLMVSCIMLVSSTYAWFTLSTAPEVAGITTNVGANGNLEMMLLTGSFNEETNKQEGSYYSSEPDLGVVSDTDDSMAIEGKSLAEANVTWGNLVNLDDDVYGLDNIVLTPARLNLTQSGEGYEVGTTILKAPSYGADGRVIAINTDTVNGKWNDAVGKKQFDFDDNHKGVRVIGTTINVSPQVSAYIQASQNVGTYIGNAKSAATNSLFTQAQNLTDMLINYATNESNPSFSADDKEALENVLTSLQTANGHVASAIKNAVLAYNLSIAVKDGTTVGNLTTEQVTQMRTKVEEITTIENEATFSNKGLIVPTGLTSAISEYVALNTKISNALGDLEKLVASGDGTYSGDAVMGVLNQIIYKQYVKIGDVMDPGKDDIESLANQIIGGGLTITMTPGSGVYADLAELIDDYRVTGITVDVVASYGGMNVNFQDLSVTMQTEVTEGPFVKQIDIGTAPDFDDEQLDGAVISDTYGYALDFGFRTNASTSDLQLQTSAVNRVYSDVPAESTINTQGSGSYMQFASTNPATFTANDVLKLMSAIRVAFVDASSNTLLKIGALDITVDKANDTYTPGNGTTEITGGYKSDLYLYDYTYNNGELELTSKLENESAITPLAQNIASKISVIVYLDGDKVDNTMVSNAAQSMTGKMNIQFSSSADLVPMENTDLRSGSTVADSTVTFTEPAVASAGAEYTNDEYGIKGKVKDGYAIYKGSDDNFYYTSTSVAEADRVYTRLTIANAQTVLEIENITVSEEDTQTDGNTQTGGDTQTGEDNQSGTDTTP